jgi:hypothetical protein
MWCARHPEVRAALAASLEGDTLCILSSFEARNKVRAPQDGDVKI